ncbi:hypothetical protein AN944_02476 [Shewanella sp. P1-14-1]|uniref:Uncharacterized protein n=1 Tax=Shewanella japonica TaxID=93973 RepID=A0ABN4YH35_9GAMM|nr:hypothetical protein SJ2017_3504 [Shewanella japonica]KPZ70092.1 hypothetical protein AN944_02476 [Shewanella sp. P1-14-1]
MLKSFNPANVKCSNCSERIRSSYGTLAGIICVYLVFFLCLIALPVLLTMLGASVDVVSIVIIALVPFILLIFPLIFEYMYYYLLSSGKIKSNLNLD